MPTIRPRYMITETDDLAAALDAAAARWPGQTCPAPSCGSDSPSPPPNPSMWRRRERRLAALNRLASGEFAYPPGYLAGLREDWPA